MIGIPASVKVFLAVEPCDLRKSFNGLHAIAQNHLREDPREGALFLFTNKRRNRLKILFFDGTGLWILIKRLERGRFSWPDRGVGDGKKMTLDRRMLALLLEGVELEQTREKKWYRG